MPTLKNRISVTLDDDTLAVLDRFAAASGTPRATVVAQMIASTADHLERAARLMEAANAATPDMLRSISEDLYNATEQGMRQLVPIDQEYTGLIRRVSHNVEWGPTSRPKRERREGAAGVGTRLRGGAAAAPAPKRRTPPSDPHLLTGGSK